MNSIKRFTQIALMALVGFTISASAADQDEAVAAQVVVDDAVKTLENFWSDSTQTLFRENVSKAHALFIIPRLGKGGFIFGGVLTVTGMLGLVPVFTAGVPNQPESLQIVSLLVPQGWAMRGLTISMDGGTVVDILPIFAGLMVWTLVLGFIGQRRLQKRFA